MLSEPGNGSDAGAASTLAVYKVLTIDVSSWMAKDHDIMY